MQSTVAPIPVIEFADQRSLEVTDIGVGSTTDGAGRSAMTVSLSTTLSRNLYKKR
ncbi:hypothetical protein [Cryobacterium sp. PH31-O1]|uniref:hypothetical protein n=1 Tax=Cryobacterium sp. PH31-O1 TaxID=3046306 RepID=UPI0024B8EC60|nr:hypothetical protein [Cryobacterium sp. PH31-O1]MDJ0337300.1 hypothetical protein [Cryobacterium sp. PH31-O1]